MNIPIDWQSRAFRARDGTTSSKLATTFVPQGPCGWELSCNSDPRAKADQDYRNRVDEALGRDLGQLTYVAVTARDWNGAAGWAAEKTAECKFKEVRAYDSNSLEHWLLDAPAVGLWLAEQIGKRILGVTDVANAGDAQERVTSRDPTNKSAGNGERAGSVGGG
jgi:hypothetical protein